MISGIISHEKNYLAVSGPMKGLYSCDIQDPVLQTHIRFGNVCMLVMGSPFYNFVLNFKRSFSCVNPIDTMLTAGLPCLCVVLYKAQTKLMLLGSGRKSLHAVFLSALLFLIISSN